MSILPPAYVKYSVLFFDWKMDSELNAINDSVVVGYN